jgi:hypothetical protein
MYLHYCNPQHLHILTGLPSCTRLLQQLVHYCIIPLRAVVTIMDLDPFAPGGGASSPLCFGEGSNQNWEGRIYKQISMQKIKIF